MFLIFNMMCRKYGFRYSLHKFHEPYIRLLPNNTFECIEVKLGYRSNSLVKLFFKAIKTMRDYRKKGCQ